MKLHYVYHWQITLMNDHMGFAKRFVVEGMNHKDAIERAYGELSEKNYNTEDFTVTEVARKGILRRVKAA